jgi:TM2 domain-containing membrane protein YozV
MALVTCPECRKSVSDAAASCPSCGYPIKPQSAAPNIYQVQPPTPSRNWHPGIAAVLSFFIPGLGQLYKRNVGTGLVWFFAVMLSYFVLTPLTLFLFLPVAIILHIACIVAAAHGDPTK